MLWSLVGRARWALRDGEGARAAFRSAIQLAPDDTRERYESQLRDIALTAAEDLVARSRDAVDAERLALLRSAHAWVRAAGPPDQSSEVRALVDRISMTYLPLCESAARAALAGGKFHEARELALDALEDARLPERRRAVIAELAGEAIEAEVSELAAGAVDNMEHGREAEALRALERGDELARNDILDGPRRDEIARRLWWAYTRLGVLRVEAEEFEQALDPLFRALRMDNVPPDNREETRWAMVRALDGLVKVRASSIREVVASGHNGAAIVQAERLWTLLRSGIAAGAPEEALLRARAMSRELLEELGQRPQ